MEGSIKMEYPCRERILQTMKRGGYFDAVMNTDSSLDRVKIFLQKMQEEPFRSNLEDKSIANPRLFPIFPNLDNKYLHESSAISVKPLIDNYFTIKEEVLALDHQENFFDYAIRDMPKGDWQIHLFSYMGVDIPQNCLLCPKTTKILNSLENRCRIYPWGDALFSVLNPGAHIPAHYSVDNLRVRCLFGIIVPDGCEMRVGTVKTGWQEGKALLFEDSFEHEVWHHGSTKRIVLIIDFWHPGLTPKEIKVLTIGLSHPRVQQTIYEFLGNDSKEYQAHLSRSMTKQVMQDDFYQYWHMDS